MTEKTSDTTTFDPVILIECSGGMVVDVHVDNQKNTNWSTFDWDDLKDNQIAALDQLQSLIDAINPNFDLISKAADEINRQYGS